MVKVYLKQTGGQNHYNEGQTHIEFIYLLIIFFFAGTGILYLLKDERFNFVETFNTKVEELHTKRNKSICDIRKREPGGGDNRRCNQLSDSSDSHPPN